MDIHKPKAAHSVREFLIEIGTIICGILIALGLEQAVEAVHNADKLEQAEAVMRLELSADNVPQAYARLAITPCLEAQLTAMKTSLAEGQMEDFSRLARRYETPMRTYDSEAWKALVSSGVSAHMSAHRLYEWSAPYRILPVLNEDTQRESEYTAELRAIGAATLTPGSRERAQILLSQLDRLNAFISRVSTILVQRATKLESGMQAADRQALLDATRRAWGACVKPIDEASLPDLSGSTLQQTLEMERKGVVAR